MKTISDRHWSDILNWVRTNHPELTRPWFKMLEPLEMQHGVLEVATADPAQFQYLSQQCQHVFSQAALAVTGRLVTVTFNPPRINGPLVEPPLMFEEETERLVLNSENTFENFVIGPCNRLAHAACVAASENPGRVYNPLFVHGSVGLGKTHLLQAMCHQILADKPDAKVLYISCETFTNHFVEAIERGALHQFRNRYRHVDALFIDDIQFLAERERSRDEFFHTFNTLFQSQKQIVLSADESPRDIKGLEERLVSRFNWGLVARIDSPCLETRMAILRKKAKLRCIEVPEDVIHYIAANVESNTRELEGALTKVLAYSQQFGGIIDLQVAQQAIGIEPQTPARKITLDDILRVVMQQYNVRLADLQGKRRHRSIAFPRQVCMYLARELTPLSLEEIGGHFGGRDHTTVLHAIRTVQGLQERDTDLEVTLKQMTDQLRRQTA